MTGLSLTDSQINEFIKEYAYKERSYRDIRLSASKGILIIEYIGAGKTNINKAIVDTYDSCNHPTLYARVKEAFDSLINQLSVEGITVVVDGKKLINNAQEARQISIDREAIKTFNTRLNNVCSGILEKHGIQFKVNDNKISLYYSGGKYELDIDTYEMINDVRYHDTILESVYIDINSIIDIIVD